jgi:hypothetical protein
VEGRRHVPAVTFFMVSSPSSYIFFIMFMSDAPGSSSEDFSPGAGFSPASLLHTPERSRQSRGGSGLSVTLLSEATIHRQHAPFLVHLNPLP